MNGIDFKNIFRAINLPCLVLKPEGSRFIIVEANETYLQIVGTTREALVGKSSREAFPQNPNSNYSGPDLFLESLQKVVSKRENDKVDRIRYDFANQLSTNYVKTYWRPESAPILNEQGEVAFILAIAQDVTAEVISKKEKLAAEAGLKEQEETSSRNEQRFKALVQEGSDILAIIGLEGNYSFVSETTTSILGFSPQEMVGEYALDFIHPEDQARLREQFRNLKEAKKVQFDTYRFRDQQGRWRLLETNATKLLQDPAVQGIVINSRDITDFLNQAREIEKMSEALKIANERFKLAMEATNEMIWDWDIATDVIKRSKAFKRIYGYSAGVTSNMVDFWFPKIEGKDRERVETSFQAALGDPLCDKWKAEYGFEKANGDIAHVLDRGYILRDERGNAIRMVGAVLDMTESEEAMKRIKNQNKLLTEIAWEQSHVVRAPLARLKGLMQVFQEEDFEELSREEIWQHLSASANELDDIVKGIVARTERNDYRDR